LLAFLRNGNKLAFEEIYNRYNKHVYRYLISLINVPEFAEDLTHEVFIRVWDIREKLEIKDSFRGYLFRICHNKAADMVKKIAKERQLTNRLVHHYQSFSEAEHHTLKELERFDALVEEALNSLSPARRRVYELCKQQGKSYQEAAEILQISPNTVKEHMAQALSSLRSFVRDKGQFAVFILLLQELL
jgi:RNA polymerase sigma-70 factor (family 1)